jgi:drug/metabolite transporter (DMT)-like permease
MKLGPVLAVLSAMVFALAQVFVMKAVTRTGETFSTVSISTIVGTAIFAFCLLFTGDCESILSLSWHGWASLSAAGIIHFVAANLLGNYAIKIIGANKASILSRTNLLYAVTFGIIFLHETVTLPMVVGILCIGFGAAFVGTSREAKGTGFHGKGVLAVLIAGFLWGLSPVLIRSAMQEIGSPVAANSVSYLAAFTAIAILSVDSDRRKQVTHINRSSLAILAGGGVFFAAGQLLRYMALIYSPVSIVSPLGCTVVFFVFIFSFLINRKIEIFTWQVFVGMAVTIFGAFLLFQ